MACLAVCLTLPTKLPAALLVEENVLERCEARVISGEGAGRSSEVDMAVVMVVVERKSANVYV